MSIGRDTLAYWTSQVGNLLFSLVTSIFVARILGAERRGLFIGVLLAGAMIANLTNLGLQATAMYFVGKDRDQLARFHTLIVILVGAITLTDLILIAVAGEALRQRLFEETPWRYLGLALVALPFLLYSFAAQGILTGLGRVLALSRFLIAYSFIANAANLFVLFVLPWKIAGLLTVWVVSQAAGAAVLLAMIWRTPCRWVRLGLKETLQGLGALLSYGFRVFIGGVAMIIVNRVDHFVILEVAKNQGLGIYSLAARIAEWVYQPSAALENAGYRQVARTDPGQAARLVQDLFRANFMITMPGIALMLLIARPFVLLLMGAEFADSVRPLQVLLPGALCLACSRMLSLYFSAQLGKPQIPSLVGWAALAINLPMMFGVVIRGGHGLLGAACVTTGCYAFILLCLFGLFAAHTRLVNPIPYFVPQRHDWARLKKLLSESRRGTDLE